MRFQKFLGLISGLILLFVGSTSIQAQCVPNGAVPGVGFFTADLDSLLDTAHLNMPYTEIITVVAPTTWNVPPLGNITVDSVLIVSVTNQPAGISILTNPSPMFLLAGDTGCIQFAGTPTDPANQGVNTLTVKFRAWAFGIPYNEDLTDFSIYLKDPTSIEAKNQALANGVRFYPNPVTSKINFSSDSKVLKFELISVLGETVISVDEPSDSYSLEDVASGLYLIRLENKEGIIEDRLIVQ